ncbi:MAG TPA: glycosyltransferase [Polyangiaceae bacterium]|nr:glycosyltransferase [Polyangiaceae bacterium]
MSTPKVSVLIPAYNAERTLEATLRSVLRQTLQSWECVVVDDGSTDRTAALLHEYARRDARVVATTSEHLGIVGALNKGLERCRGDYVARLDADDVMHRLRLERQYAFARCEPEIGALGCHVRIFPRRAGSGGRRGYERWLNSLVDEASLLRDRFVECPLAHPSFFVRNDVFAAHPYRDVPWAEDYDLLLRLQESGVRVGVVPEVLLFWREGPTRLSRVDSRYSIERFVECKAHFLSRRFLADESGYVLWGYGDTGRALARALRGHRKHPTHIVELHPGRVGQRIANAPVIAPIALRELTPRPHRIVVSVAGEAARSEIRARLAEMRFEEGRDYVCAA